MPPSLYHLPTSPSPLNPPSNRALTGLNGLNHHSLPPLLRPPPSALPRPYKSHPDEPRSTPHLTTPFSSPLPRQKPSPPSSCVLFEPPPSPRRRPSSCEARAELSLLLSLFCAPAGELWCTGAAGGHTPVSTPPCSGTIGPRRHRSTVDRARSAGSPRVDPVHAFTCWKIIC
jgi:hypothetical protein